MRKPDSTPRPQPARQLDGREERAAAGVTVWPELRFADGRLRQCPVKTEWGWTAVAGRARPMIQRRMPRGNTIGSDPIKRPLRSTYPFGEHERDSRANPGRRQARYIRCA